jgi:hypothetical protein
MILFYFLKRAFADVIRMSTLNYLGWGLNKRTSVFIRDRERKTLTYRVEDYVKTVADSILQPQVKECLDLEVARGNEGCFFFFSWNFGRKHGLPAP